MGIIQSSFFSAERQYSGTGGYCKEFVMISRCLRRLSSHALFCSLAIDVGTEIVENCRLSFPGWGGNWNTLTCFGCAALHLSNGKLIFDILIPKNVFIYDSGRRETGHAAPALVYGKKNPVRMASFRKDHMSDFVPSADLWE